LVNPHIAEVSQLTVISHPETIAAEVEAEVTAATDLDDAQGHLATDPRAETTTETPTRPAATTESAKEKTDMLEVAKEVVRDAEARGSGIVIAALQDVTGVTETTVDHAGETEIFSMTVEAVVAGTVSPSNPPGEAPVLPRNPRSPLLT
jgi:cell pole-organizing protein PopZ